MRKAVFKVIVFAGLSVGCVGFSARVAAATVDCTQLPAPDPKKTFLGNFSNNCYWIGLSESNGTTSYGGDPHAKYSVLYYRVLPQYELIVFGTYPNSRYFSITAYDDHEATIGWLRDEQIVPLSSSGVNPYQPGVPFTDNQQYAVVVGLGGSEPPPEAVQPGCGFGTFAVGANFIDGSARHTGLSWDGDPVVPAFWPPHNTGPSLAGFMMVRRYMDQPAAPALSKPLVLVRDLTTGCAVPADQAVNVLQIVSQAKSSGLNWMDSNQIFYHYTYSHTLEPKLCYAADKTNSMYWIRGPEYEPGPNPDAAYMSARGVTFAGMQNMFLRLRLRIPYTPLPPSPGSIFTGLEDLRYWSLTFMNGRATVAGISDADLVRDPDGYVTLIVGLGTPPPSQVTPENGYTYFDLSQFPNYTLVNALNIRSVLPSAGFLCEEHQIPFRSSQYNSLGGFMGEYVPTADVLAGDAIPLTASPYVRVNSCGVTPPESPVVCHAR